MDKIINEENIDDYREGNLYEAVKSIFLNIIESIYPSILENNQLTEDKLDKMVIAVSDSEEVNDFIDNEILTQIDEFAKENNIEKEEER